MLVNELVPFLVELLNSTMYSNHPHICISASSTFHMVFINFHIYWWIIILIIHGSFWNTVSLYNKWSRSMLIFKKYSKNQLFRKPSVPLKSNFFINVVADTCFLVYIFSTFKSYIPKSRSNSSFDKPFALKSILSFIGIKKTIINFFDINSKQYFKSLCDK